MKNLTIKQYSSRPPIHRHERRRSAAEALYKQRGKQRGARLLGLLASSLTLGLFSGSAIAQISPAQTSATQPSAAQLYNSQSYASTDNLESIDQINVFGDSLSDAGNIFTLSEGTFPPSPPYARRLSNGPVWVEAIASELGLSPRISATAVPPILAGIAAPPADGINFAVGGSLSSNVNVGGPPLPGLQQQVATFSALSQAGAGPSDNALHILLAGGNDYNEAVLSAPPAELVGLADQVTDNLIDAVLGLVEAGAKNLLVSNLPVLGLQPFANSINEFNPQSVNLLSALSSRHNQLLDRKLSALSAVLDGSGVTLTQFDFESLSKSITANPTAFGFENVDDSCLVNPDNPLEGTCADPDAFFFWDDVHPTEAGHAVVAQAALQTLAHAAEADSELPAIENDSARVPEPTGVVALLAFSGALLSIRKRA